MNIETSFLAAKASIRPTPPEESLNSVVDMTGYQDQLP